MMPKKGIFVFAILFVYFLLKRIDAIGVDFGHSLVVSLAQKYIVAIQVIPFHEYQDHLTALWNFLDEVYYNIMQNKLNQQIGDVEE